MIFTTIRFQIKHENATRSLRVYGIDDEESKNKREGEKGKRRS